MSFRTLPQAKDGAACCDVSNGTFSCHPELSTKTYAVRWYECEGSYDYMKPSRPDGIPPFPAATFGMTDRPLRRLRHRSE